MTAPRSMILTEKEEFETILTFPRSRCWGMKLCTRIPPMPRYYFPWPSDPWTGWYISISPTGNNSIHRFPLKERIWSGSDIPGLLLRRRQQGWRRRHARFWSLLMRSRANTCANAVPWERLVEINLEDNVNRYHAGRDVPRRRGMLGPTQTPKPNTHHECRSKGTKNQ